MFTKSGIMVGLGERNEVLQLMDDLRSAGRFLTIGQYLARKHHPVARFVTPGSSSRTPQSPQGLPAGFIFAFARRTMPAVSVAARNHLKLAHA